MKKFILFCITFVTIFSTAVQAKVGDIIGAAYHTDIVAYINHYAIPSYAVNGTSCIVAEDLKNFGFDVLWNNSARTLSISRNSSTSVSQMNFSKSGSPSDKFADLLETDITVYANNIKLTSYSISGYTMIPLEELTMFGTCSFIESERALKLWVDNLHIRTVKQYVQSYGEALQNPVTSTVTSQSQYYAGTTVPDYTYVTGVPLKDVSTNNGGAVFSYNYTRYGEYSEMTDYLGYLMRNGWTEYKTKSDSSRLTYYYVKSAEMVSVSYYPKYSEVWVTVLYN